MLSSVIDSNRLAVRGLALFGASSGSTSVMYGPKRPFLATSSRPVSGWVPSVFSWPAGLASSSFAIVERELVGRQVLGDVGARRHLRAAVAGQHRRALDVRAVAADPQVDALADLERGQAARVDVGQVLDAAA